MMLGALCIVGYFACLYALRFVDPYQVTRHEALICYGIILLIFLACCLGLHFAILHPYG